MLAEQLNSEEARELLSTVDQMRMILHEERISMPEIVVVGDQSVGKSSVLEAISGIELPRAQNICTRCPLELRMKSTTGEEYATITSRETNKNAVNDQESDIKIQDLTKISDEVTKITEKLAGHGNNCSSNPIYLTIYKRDIQYDLTLIDLPGITRNPAAGQATDIYSQILKLINKYIEPETAVVLHVIPASTDFTTSETLKLAKVFDPKCERQLIAVSKIDKFDKGISENLQGEGPGAMPLKLGCVAVLNRNPVEIEQNISFSEMRRREAQFFIDNCTHFDDAPDELKGSEQLVRRLVSIQQEHIRSTFPQILQKLKDKIQEKNAELTAMPVMITSEHEFSMKFYQLVHELQGIIQMKLDGNYNIINVDRNTVQSDSDSNDDACLENDRLAYHIYACQQRFKNRLKECFKNISSLEYHKNVWKAITDTSGITLPNIYAPHLIQRLFQEEIGHVPDVCFSFVEDMLECIKTILIRLFNRTFNKYYSRLADRLRDVLERHISTSEKLCRASLEEILEMEQRVFTLNDQYMEIVNIVKQDKMAKVNEQYVNETTTMQHNQARSNTVSAKIARQTRLTDDFIDYSPTSNESQAAFDMQLNLFAYAHLVQSRIADNVSQVLYYRLVTHCALTVDGALLSSISSSSELARLMREPQEQTNRRNKLKHSIQRLEEALLVGQNHI
ncbi:unnamed protein product [Rotaria magnacalcarata]|uniref:Uncharacterized protein n=1 Tax=Rotaria magnacalcarata TaxID=392030 RepID=A0A820A8W1_9BILA|nr:unnamed protein product [Rotaria magnacalcarata]CAF4172930.1 unnamed protein product [Rotaria magnacalcarata]